MCFRIGTPCIPPLKQYQSLLIFWQTPAFVTDHLYRHVTFRATFTFDPTSSDDQGHNWLGYVCVCRGVTPACWLGKLHLILDFALGKVLKDILSGTDWLPNMPCCLAKSLPPPQVTPLLMTYFIFNIFKELGIFLLIICPHNYILYCTFSSYLKINFLDILQTIDKTNI